MQILNVKSCVRILLACKNKDIISTVRLKTFLVVIILNLRIAADKTGQILRTKVVNEDDICQKMLKLQTPAKDLPYHTTTLTCHTPSNTHENGAAC